MASGPQQLRDRTKRAREFVAKLGIVVEEVDEAELWLEALLKCQLAPPNVVEPLYCEARELRAIFVQSLYTARSHTPKRSRAQAVDAP